MNVVTTIVINDPELLAKIAAAEGQIIFREPAGATIKTVETVVFGKLPPGMKSPYTDEEIEAARKEPDSGVTLEEFWSRVKSGTWK